MARDRMARVGRRRGLPSSFTLELLLAGLTTGLLVSVAGALLEETSAIDAQASWDQCAGLQVRSPYAAMTYLHLDNIEPERIGVRVDYLAEDGSESPIEGYVPVLDPGASSDIRFKTPALGAAVLLVSSAKGLHASATIYGDGGESPESRHAFLCLAQ